MHLEHNRSGQRFRNACVAIAAILILSCSIQQSRAAQTLTWNTNKGLVSADIRNGQLGRVLGQIAGATGWTVLVEPGADHKVSTRFKELPPGQALGRLLGDLSFAMLPASTNAAPKLLVFATAAGNATQAVRAIAPDAKAATNIISNELIVRLKPGADIEALARQFGAKVTGSLKDQNTYRLRFENAEAAELAREALSGSDLVASVDSNYSISRPRDPGSLSGPDLPARASLTMKAPAPGGRVVVGLIDTAVQSLGPELDPFLLQQVSVAGPSQVISDEPLHGTSMAETLLKSLQYSSGGSTSVQILPVDVYGPNASTSTFDLANGIVQAVNGGARVINLSLGSEADSPMLRDIVSEASSKGVLFFAAAGNAPVTTPFYPAAYPEVMAVTAVEHGQIAPYANRGDFISLAAPGTSVVYFNDQAYYVTGTSSSSAFTAGAAAGFMERTQSSAQQTKEHLTALFGVKSQPGGAGTRLGSPLQRR